MSAKVRLNTQVRGTKPIAIHLRIVMNEYDKNIKKSPTDTSLSLKEPINEVAALMV